MNNLNKDRGFIAGIRHERKNVEPRSIFDLFLAEMEKHVDPPISADSDSSEADPPAPEALQGPSDDSTG